MIPLVIVMKVRTTIVGYKLKGWPGLGPEGSSRAARRCPPSCEKSTTHDGGSQRHHQWVLVLGLWSYQAAAHSLADISGCIHVQLQDSSVTQGRSTRSCSRRPQRPSVTHATTTRGLMCCRFLDRPPLAHKAHLKDNIVTITMTARPELYRPALLIIDMQNDFCPPVRSLPLQ